MERKNMDPTVFRGNMKIKRRGEKGRRLYAPNCKTGRKNRGAVAASFWSVERGKKKRKDD